MAFLHLYLSLALARFLQESSLPTAEHIFRLAFGTFIGKPQPTEFGGDANYVQPRGKVEPSAAFAAEVDGKLVGSNIAICWDGLNSYSIYVKRMERLKKCCVSLLE